MVAVFFRPHMFHFVVHVSFGYDYSYYHQINSLKSLSPFAEEAGSGGGTTNFLLYCLVDSFLSSFETVTPVFLPGKSHGLRSLVGYMCPWGHKESDTTEQLHLEVSYFTFLESPAFSKYCSLPKDIIGKIFFKY